MKVAVITTSRADYGLLYWPLKKLSQDEYFDVRLVVAGSHLSPSGGYSVRQIEADGWDIDCKIEMMLSSDTALGACKSLALAIVGFAEYFARSLPDLVMVVGDRYEMTAAAQSAVMLNLPIAHIAGGDVTEGAFDDTFRHCLTKMSHIHLPSNETARQRIIQMGENPDCVITVGSPGIDYIVRCERLSRADIEKRLGFAFKKRNVLVTFHPETADRTGISSFAEMLSALGTLDDQTGIVFTMPNADPDGLAIAQMIYEFCATHANAISAVSLGSDLYLSLMAEVNAVVGNSSSGLYEAPTLGTPTVNIGNRQKGRLCASSVITTVPAAESIRKAIHAAIDMSCDDVVNPYGDGDASERIVAALRKFPNPSTLVRKSFQSNTLLCQKL